MSVGFTLHVDDANILAGLRGLRHAVEDLSPALHEIGDELEQSTVMRFVTNIAPDGSPWAQSAAALKRGSPTLSDTTLLRNSIHYVLDGDAVEVGSALAYAGVHQGGIDEEVVVSSHERRFTMVFGRRISGVTNVMPHSRRMKLPARPFLGVSAGDGAAILDIIGDHLARAAGGQR